jgi:hypothetical protein
VARCLTTLQSSQWPQFIEHNSGGAQFGRKVLAAGEKKGTGTWTDGFHHGGSSGDHRTCTP